MPSIFFHIAIMGSNNTYMGILSNRPIEMNNRTLPAKNYFVVVVFYSSRTAAVPSKYIQSFIELLKIQIIIDAIEYFG